MSSLVRLRWRQALHDMLWIAAVGLAPAIMSIAVLIARGELFDDAGILTDDAQFAIYATTLIGATFLNIVVNGRVASGPYRTWGSYALLASVVLTFFSSGLYVATVVGGDEISRWWLRSGTMLTYAGALVLAFLSGVLSDEGIGADRPEQEFTKTEDDLEARLRRAKRSEA